MKKKMFTLWMTGLFLLLTTLGAAAQNSGTTGPLNWNYDAGTKTLSITGTGAMPDFTLTTRPPWEKTTNPIEKIVIEAGVTSVGAHAFRNCAVLTSVTLPAGVQTIGDNAFHACEKLTNITLPAGLERLGDGAFGECGALASITLPEGLQTIERNAFGECLALTHVTIPKSVTTIGDGAFTNCWKLASVTLPADAQLGTIGENAFYGCEKLASLTIPKSVNTIGELAFAYCVALKDVTASWPDATSIPVIQSNVFDYLNPGNIKLHVPAGTGEAYQGKDVWKEFTIVEQPWGDLSTGLHWEYDDATRTLTISNPNPGTPKSMPDFADFNDQPWKDLREKKIKTVVIEAGVTSIGNKAFTGCEAMTSVTLPESGLETIGEKAFMGCEKLLSITIPKSVTTIKERAFLYCQALGGVTVGWTEARFIPAISELEYVFFSPSDHQSKVLHVPAGTAEMYRAKDVWKKFFIMAGKTAGGDLSTGLHWAYDDETKTLSITGAGEIPDYNYPNDRPWNAFMNKARTLTLAEGVTKIGKNAFAGFQVLPSITLPKSVATIGEYAFINCHKLTDVTVAWKDAGSIPNIQANVFDDVTLSDVTLYVPEGMVDTYKAKNVWKDFDIQETPPTLSAALTDAAPMAWTAGSTKQIKVQGNKKWKATIPAAAQTWLEFAGGDGITIVSESPDTTLTVKAKNANGITAARTATLDFVFEDGSGPATPVTVAVTQVAFSPTLSVTPATLTFTFDGEDKALTVTANRPWTAQCDASWITLSATSGTGNGTITVTAPAYEDEQPRTANIFFVSGALKETVTVTQNPKPGPAFVALDYTELTLPAGASQRLVVTAYPKDADIHRDVKWYSSNNDIATVSRDGTVTALAPGRADITVVANVGGQQTACRVRVVPAEQMVSVTSGGDNTLRLALVAPSDADFTLSFDVDLPEGFALDAKKTAPDASLAAGYAVTVTGKRVEMKPNGLRSGSTMEKRNLLTFACTAAPGTSKGSYKAALRNLTFTPTAGYALQNITVPFTFTHTVANQTIDGLRVYAADGALHLTLPKAETVHIYNVVGSLVRTMNASAGDHVLPLSSGMYVVRVGERVTKILIK
ncbi:bacterial group 2 Ig-like protein [Tannerella forsythia 92A2]|uniref:Bacterial group 2 Ig-like protein n=1 Tax=Tannerella forsythia (strain ATCC 43037 / JCM 10827 / CCUG 21028 A / KCTC 5666 / FDC 338) TaxID=203275 RepID=G8UNZ0_TANFA|nr:leucine-rich repeat protein [Tannerella forsythia]AEW19976.1 bacterial group 2 Ig-like protein [Tannerella forsythia 92A2]